MSEMLPDELILEILSWLPVMSVMRFKCVSKTWKFLISNSYLIKLHLERSSRNLEILLVTTQSYHRQFFLPRGESLPFIARLGSLPCFIQNPAPSSFGRILECPKPYKYLFGSCNGLLSLHNTLSRKKYEEHWVCFWNPATKMCSKPSPRLRLNFDSNIHHHINFGFGYDDRRDNYKVVAMVFDWRTRQTSMWFYCMGDVCWRGPLMTSPIFVTLDSNGYSLNGTVNWIGISLEESRTQKLQIFSYDLNNDTYKGLSVPELLSKNSCFPAMDVLNGCLCVSLCIRNTYFVVWALRDVRDETSWSRLMSVSYETLNICLGLDYYKMRILCMWGDLLLLTYSKYWGDYNFIIIFNLKENKVECTQAYNKQFLSHVFRYVPSLILPI